MPTTQTKTAFITGANKGIGLETARGLGKLGISVVLGARDLKKGEAAVKELAAEGINNARAFQFDVTSTHDHQRVAEYLQRSAKAVRPACSSQRSSTTARRADISISASRCPGSGS